MKQTTLYTLSAFSLLSAGSLLASSHREAPGITETPKIDATDFYMFNSYEAGREGFVTLIANYVPLQDAYGGPNYFFLDEDAIYEIHIDNNGNAEEDITFQFDFANNFQPLQLPIGEGANQKMVAIPLLAAGQVDSNNPATNANLRLEQNYTVKMITGDRRTGTVSDVKLAGTATTTFTKPMDNIGNKTFPDYDGYAAQFVYEIDIPGCATPGRLFVGQRKDPFVVNLGETFDLVNLNPLGPPDDRKDDLEDANVTAIILELPAECLTNTDSVIGAWTTASLPDGNGGFTQASRLGQPLVNEVVIGVQDKDAFNASEPKDDAQFATYVTHPTLPALLEILFGVTAPTAIPRADLVQIFLTGVPSLNQPSGIVGSEMLRLNTNVDPNNGGIPAKPAAMQNPLAVLAGDTAGFPNGRRPGDDVVDIALRGVMGVLLPLADAPSGQLAYTDGAAINASVFAETFPYLNSPIPGSPNDPVIEVTLQGSSDLVNFLALGSGVSYDSESKEITAPSLGIDRGFYRLKTDETGVSIQIGAITDETVKIRVVLNETP